MPSTNERSCLVVGGGRGLGRAIAERLGREGWAVGVLARTGNEVEATARAVQDAGGTACSLVADVLEPAGLGRVFERFRSWAGRLDALVIAAGRLRAIGPLAAVDPEAWWADLETSVRGTQRAIRAALPILRDSDRPSITVLVGPGQNGPVAHAAGYGAAQAALVRLVESLAIELERDGIAIYAVNPGLVPTALVRRLIDTPEGRRWLPRFNEAFAEGKEVGPEATSEMVAWLARTRPIALNGRVVAAPLGPDVLATRLDRIVAEDRGRLRLT